MSTLFSINFLFFSILLIFNIGLADDFTDEEIFAELRKDTYCGMCHRGAAYLEEEALQDPALKKLLYDRLRWLEVADHEPAMGGNMPPDNTSQRTEIKKEENKPFVKALLNAVRTDLTPPPPIGSEELRKAVDENIVVPKGFKVTVYAQLRGARSMVLTEKGTLIVGTGGLGSPPDVLYAIRDKNRNNVAEDTEIHTFAENMDNPNGVAIINGDLYVAERNKLRKFPKIDKWLDENDQTKKFNLANTTIVQRFPEQSGHYWKYVRANPHDGHLYLPLGYPGNVGGELPDKAIVYKIDVTNNTKTIVARGVRNSVGLDFHPDKNEMWMTDNGRDSMGDDLPRDRLNSMSLDNLTSPVHFGFPYCHTRNVKGDFIKDPSNNQNRNCSDFKKASVGLQAHAAALGMRFYTGTRFPKKYQKQMFIAERGSWNRSANVDHNGNRITLVTKDANGELSYEVFAHGWLIKDPLTGLRRDRFGRPVDVEVMPDGSLLVSDSGAQSSLLGFRNTGALYRIEYTGE